MKYSRRWLNAKKKKVGIKMNYAFVKQLSSWRAIHFVTSVIERHSILGIPKVRYTLYVQFSHSSYHSAPKTFTHIPKHSPSTSTNSSLGAEGRNKNQPSKSDSFHLALNHIILLWMFFYLNFDIVYISHRNNRFKIFHPHGLDDITLG